MHVIYVTLEAVILTKSIYITGIASQICHAVKLIRLPKVMKFDEVSQNRALFMTVKMSLE